MFGKPKSPRTMIERILAYDNEARIAQRAGPVIGSDVLIKILIVYGVGLYARTVLYDNFAQQKDL
jgi:hypothetical protein